MVSYIAKGRSSAARTRLLGLKDDEVACISAITEAEIRYGLAKRPEATALKALMDGFLASIHVLPWGRDEAEAYGVLRAKLEPVRDHPGAIPAGSPRLRSSNTLPPRLGNRIGRLTAGPRLAPPGHGNFRASCGRRPASGRSPDRGF